MSLFHLHSSRVFPMDIAFYIGHSLSVFPSSVKMSHCPTVMLSVREIHGPGVRGLPWVQDSNKHRRKIYSKSSDCSIPHTRTIVFSLGILLFTCGAKFHVSSCLEFKLGDAEDKGKRWAWGALTDWGNVLNSLLPFTFGGPQRAAPCTSSSVSLPISGRQWAALTPPLSYLCFRISLPWNISSTMGQRPSLYTNYCFPRLYFNAFYIVAPPLKFNELINTQQRLN